MSILAWSCHQHQGGRFQRSKVSSVDTQLESLPKISHQIEDSIWGSWHPNRGMVRFIWCQVDRIWLACPGEILSVANTYKLRFLLLCCSLSRWHQGQYPKAIPVSHVTGTGHWASNQHSASQRRRGRWILQTRCVPLIDTNLRRGNANILKDRLIQSMCKMHLWFVHGCLHVVCMFFAFHIPLLLASGGYGFGFHRFLHRSRLKGYHFQPDQSLQRLQRRDAGGDAVPRQSWQMWWRKVDLTRMIPTAGLVDDFYKRLSSIALRRVVFFHQSHITSAF